MLTPGKTSDVVIIGGGVIGLTVARALRLRGVRDVMLIERGQIGAEASWAAGGILAPQVEAEETNDFFRLACQSRDLYPTFANALREETGVEVELDRTGTIYLGFTDEDANEMSRVHEWQTRAGLRVEQLTRDEARKLEPCVSASVNGALFFPNDIQVENRKLVRALTAANEELGVRIVVDCEARALRVRSGKIHAVDTSLGPISTRIAVLAAGAWTSLIESPDTILPSVRIEPVRGQMLCFDAPKFAQHVIYSSRGYLVPRRDGRLLAGSTSEQVGFDKTVTDQGVNQIKSMAAEIAPALALLPLLASWAGFRPRAADDLPVLGPCKEINGLFYAAGHYRNGILLAPVTGELIADAIVGKAVPSLHEPFSPDRVACQKPDREGGHVALADARASDTTGF